MNLNKELPNDLITTVSFPEDQFVKVEYNKKQIVLHHSAGWDYANGMIDWWKSNKERVATCVGIEDSGKIYKIFDSKYYAWHINILSAKNNIPFTKYRRGAHALMLERHSIGVEICNWGGLTLINGEFHTYASKGVTGIGGKIVVPKSKVQHYPNKFRGYEFYERYTDAEIESLYKLISYWCDFYGIDKSYKENMWDINESAIRGDSGVWTHVSYRSDKSDCHPQPELIEMLKAL